MTASLLPARFESVRLLGRGGMGAVFLAWDSLLFRHVAVKILASEFAGDRVARERFAREAALAGRLGAHPHIVTAHEAGEWEQRPYVVFEYMPRGSLADQLQDNGPPLRSQTPRRRLQSSEPEVHRDEATIRRASPTVNPTSLCLLHCVDDRKSAARVEAVRGEERDADAAREERVAARQALHLLERVHREGTGPLEPELVARPAV